MKEETNDGYPPGGRKILPPRVYKNFSNKN